MKLTASPSRDFSPCPGEGEYLKPQASLFFILSDLAGPSVGGCSAHAPEPPRAFLFLVEEKEAKDHLGGSPLKTPRGSALAASPDPTAGFLGGRSKHNKRAEAHSPYWKTLLFMKLCRYRATARQADSPISGANGSESSQGNLSLFRPNRAGRGSSREGLQPSMLTTMDP